MSILKVARMGHPALRRKTRPLSPSEITTAGVQTLIDDMTQTMLEYRGVGLAAPQVHEDVRLFVSQVITSDDEPDEGAGEIDEAPARRPTPIQVMAVINPEIAPLTRKVEEDWEGCLSIPDLRGLVPRYRDIRVRGYDRTGERVEIKASGYMARVIQHETDHLDGVLFLDRMKSLESLSFLDEYARYHADRD
ncbi:MAG: peptide deformylase [Acidobacteriota bacterium]